ncbi:MAG TPA: APC family permease [Candidatus Acidoferrum sp.]|nr:APC family permease [Candidatus Acidoferrum sp.]
MSQAVNGTPDPIKQLRKEMGFWDVLLFNIATVLGPRWIAAAAHNGTSSISLWLLASLFFFVPTAFVITELSTRFPHEGGLYVWSKEAFGDFHGFVAGWTYWIYSFFYFPGLLLASAAMGAYIGGSSWGHLAQSKTFLLGGSFLLLSIAVGMNIVGLNVGKWLQNAGGVMTYVPLLLLVATGGVVWLRYGSATHFTLANMMPRWNWETVNFWPQILFAFAGLELVSAMSDEIHNAQRTLARAIWSSGILIAVIYIVGTFAVLGIMQDAQVDPKSGVYQALAIGSEALKIGLVGMIAAFLVTFGNAGGVGTTVAGLSRVPFIVGVDRYLPAAFGKLHPRWRTPYVSILVQAGISLALLVLSNINETTSGAYQILVDAATILYFIPFLYMYAAVIKLAGRKDRREREHAVLIPGGKIGVWMAGGLGFLVTLAGIALSFVPPGESANKFVFSAKLIGGTVIAVGLGLVLYYRGARAKKTEASVA